MCPAERRRSLLDCALGQVADSSEELMRREAGAGVARWQAWWPATCADQSAHRIPIGGKPVCQVPIEQGVRR